MGIEGRQGIIQHSRRTMRELYIGIDAGSTTVKAAVINSDGKIVTSRYMPNSGDPVSLIKQFLIDFYKEFPDAVVASSAVTGYGEDIIKNAFAVDIGLVETVADMFSYNGIMNV